MLPDCGYLQTLKADVFGFPPDRQCAAGSAIPEHLSRPQGYFGIHDSVYRTWDEAVLGLGVQPKAGLKLPNLSVVGASGSAFATSLPR